jgi:hypothetical protein
MFETEIINPYKFNNTFYELQLRRASSPVNHINDFKKRIEKKNRNNKINNKRTSVFHLPLINFSPEKNKDNEKNERDKIKAIRNSKVSVLNNNNLNLSNNFGKKNDNYNHRKTETLATIIKNLKGISEKLRNPTTFFSNNLRFGKKNKKLSSNIISKIFKNEIENMKENIVKIDSIYEKLLESIIKKLLKRK